MTPCAWETSEFCTGYASVNSVGDGDGGNICESCWLDDEESDDDDS